MRATGQRVSLLSYVAFLFGARRAIEAVLSARAVFPLAVLLTISAGFAREYDGEYLVAEPWYVLVPLAVALAMGTVLFLVLLATSWRFHPPGASGGRTYLQFLTCYLLTAPLAWLYAIPYERMFNELDATRCNLWTLSLVSAWRVLLITRIASIQFRRHFLAMLAPVMLFASTAAVIALGARIRLPEIMAGVRMSDMQQLIHQATDMWFMAALFTWPIWALLAVVAATARPGDSRPVSDETRRAKPNASWILAAVASVLVWALFLSGPQREQGLRYEVERLFARKEIANGLRLVTAHEQSEFPPHWQPPPVGYREFPDLSLTDVIEHFSANEPPDWVREPYFEKLTRVLSAHHGAYLISETDWPRLVDALHRLPEGPTVACDAYAAMKLWWEGDRIGDCVSELLELARQNRCPEALMDTERRTDGP